jgi:hypothetical protein
MLLRPFTHLLLNRKNESKPPDFDSVEQSNPYGQDYWRERDLAPLLEYIQWRNFEQAIKKAMIACAETSNIVEYHFADTSKPITGGKGAVQHVKDYNLSRLACYLIAQNGDPRKPEIAAAQVYFAVSTRAHKIHQLRKAQEERLEARLKVSESFKQNVPLKSNISSCGRFRIVRETQDKVYFCSEPLRIIFLKICFTQIDKIALMPSPLFGCIFLFQFLYYFFPCDIPVYHYPTRRFPLKAVQYATHTHTH